MCLNLRQVFVPRYLKKKSKINDGPINKVNIIGPSNMILKIYNLFQRKSKNSRTKLYKLASYEDFKDTIIANVKNIYKDEKFLLSKYEEYCILYEVTKLESLNGVKTILGFCSKNTCLEYWTSRGWPYELAIAKLKNRQGTLSIENIAKSKNVDIKKAKEIKKLRIDKGVDTLINRPDYDDICKSRGNGMRVQPITKKINPTTNKCYTEDEAKMLIFRRASNRASVFWNEVRAGNRRFIASTSLEYFLRDGLSLEDAKIALKQRQATFSKQICIEKYGEEAGLKRFKERQDRWINTLNSLPEEEKQRILIQKTSRSKRYSKEATAFFIKLLDALGIDIDNEYVKMCDNELFLWSKSKKICFYDFAMMDKKIIIEYHGSAFHPHYSLTEDQLKTWINPYSKLTGDQQRLRDLEKKVTAIDSGYTFFEIWDKDDHDLKIKEIVCFLKGNI